ncbi:hypothetical protein CYMTET_41482 [Cymbomonas tetramitiformis]|uniref:Aquaporin n=1 Tax=Cymbomonas tetramitiformis TaxID=36881 RepID=A0AAE0C7R4_9CHLO|nr:hypothetical protein CYMTET_41482 [Cymbomonas tetramitiformis]
MKQPSVEELMRMCAAEFLALFLFVFLSCGSALVTGATVTSISLSFGFTILALGHCFGHISGGHINPAVTIALTAAQKVDPIRCACFIIAQVLGAVLGAATLYGVMDKDSHNCLGSNMVADGYEVGQAFGLELVTTFVLVLTVFATTDEKNSEASTLGVFPIAMSVMICHLISIPLTGCGINPARSFGPATVAVLAGLECADKVMDDHYIFWFAPILGGLLAAFTYQMILTDNWLHASGGLIDVLRSKTLSPSNITVQDGFKPPPDLPQQAI